MPAPIVAAKMARRFAPVAMEAYRRWQKLSPEEKERYRQRAKDAGDRARRAYQAQRRRPPR